MFKLKASFASAPGLSPIFSKRRRPFSKMKRYFATPFVKFGAPSHFRTSPSVAPLSLPSATKQEVALTEPTLVPVTKLIL
jgi:hypothetical protein